MNPNGTTPAQAIEASTADPSDPGRPIVLALSLIAAACVLLSIQVHEYAHGLAALIETGGAWVRSGSADSLTRGTDTQQGIIALAGPVFSLLSGLAIYFGTRRLPEGFGRWVATWFGLASLMNFFGYLMTSIAGGTGDIGGAIALFGLPGWISIPLFFVGTAGMFWLAWLFCHDVRRVSDDIKVMRRIGIWPWLFGTLIVVVVIKIFELTTSVVAGLTAGELILVTIASFATLVFAPMFTFFIKLVPYGGGRPDPGRPWQAWALFAVAVIVHALHAFFRVKIGG